MVEDNHAQQTQIYLLKKKNYVFPEGVDSCLGSSGWAYVGEFHPKCSTVGTIDHLGYKT